MTVIKKLSISEILCDEARTRASLREHVVNDYTAGMRQGDEFPVPVVFVPEDGGRPILAAGAHRIAAMERLGHTTVECEVRIGGRREAIKHGLKDNADQLGERLSNADKRHNVRLVLREMPELSDSAIAKMCGVSDKTVATRRRNMESTSEIPKLTEREGLDGRKRGGPLSVRERILSDKWYSLSVEDRRQDCMTWWDLQAAATLFLYEAGIHPPEIAELLGVDLWDDVVPVIGPRIRERNREEFDEVFEDPDIARQAHEYIQVKHMGRILSYAYLNACGHAKRIGLARIEQTLTGKSALFATSCHQIINSEGMFDETETDGEPDSSSTTIAPDWSGFDEGPLELINLVALWDARIALGIERREELRDAASKRLAEIRTDSRFGLCEAVEG